MTRVDWYRPRAAAVDGWVDRAACRGASPAVFFPGPDGDDTLTPAAAGYCWACPVRQACLDTAIRDREPDGIWGGLTPRQRRSQIRTATRTARTTSRCGTDRGYDRHRQQHEPVCGACRVAHQRTEQATA